MSAGIQVNKVGTLTGHRDSVYALQSSAQPDIFFSGAGDGMVVQWDLREPGVGERIAQLPNSIYALHVVPELDTLIVGHNYDGIHWLDTKNRRELASLKLTNSAIFDVESFRGKLFVATGDGAVVVVDDDQRSIDRRLEYSKKSARTIAVNSRRGELAVGYSDNFIRIFDLSDYSLKSEWQAHDNSVFTLSYTPDHSLLISGSRDARLKAWESGPDYSLRHEVVAHLFAINHIAFSPDGKHFVTCSMDKSVKVWRAQDLTLLKVIDKARHAGHATSVNKLLWTTFKNQVISASDDRTISIWDVIF